MEIPVMELGIDRKSLISLIKAFNQELAKKN